MRIRTRRLLLAAVLSIPSGLPWAGLSAAPLDGEAGVKDLKSDDFFKIDKVWTLHLTLTPEAWAQMEPSGGGFGGFGGPRGGPGGPGGRGGPGGFGPAMLLVPSFLRDGDQNKDGKLSKEELQGLGEKWFAEWDKEKTGKLTGDQLATGLSATVLAGFGGPGAGGPGAGGPGAGGAGGPPPRGPGMNLQGPEGKRNGLASAMGVEFKQAHADLEVEGQSFKDVAVRYKGNGTFMESRGSIKRSLKIDLNEFVKGQKLAGTTKLNLHNNVTDASWMNEVLSHRFFRDAGVPAPRTTYARVFVTVPGKYDRQYLGLYSIVENVDSNFVVDRFQTRIGAIFKPVTPSFFADLGDDWKLYNQTYDPKTKLTPEQERRIIDLSKLVSKADDSELAARIGDYIDFEEFARYMAALVCLVDLDGILGPGQNLYLFLHPGTQKISFIPWDLDHSFGQFPMRGTQEQREQLNIHRPWQGENRFLERLFKVESFKKLYLARLEVASKSLLLPERIGQQVDQLAAAIRPAVQEESAEKLERFAKVVAGEAPGSGGFAGFGFRAPSKPIKAFVKIRAPSISEQLAGKSVGQTLGEFGFGGGPGRGGPGGRGGFGPGGFLRGIFLSAMDSDKNGDLAHEELTKGFGAWFDSWDTEKTGLLGEEQLRVGINRGN